jgi:hypothetical protein
MQRFVKKLLLSALLIFCAPLGFHHAQGERDGESNDKTHTSSEILEVSSIQDETDAARQLRMIPFASYVLFLKEYSEIEE